MNLKSRGKRLSWRTKKANKGRKGSMSLLRKKLRKSNK